MSMGTQDFYRLLEVRRDATADEIRAAYERLALEYQLGPNKTLDADNRFKEATRAYEILSDAEKRALYDDLIGPETAVGSKQGATPSVTGVAGAPWTPGDVVKGVLLLVALELGAATALGLVLVLVMALRGDSTGANDGLFFAALQIGELIMFVVAWRFTVLKYHSGWGSLGFRVPAAAASAIKWTAITVVAMIVVSGVYGAVVTALRLNALDPGPTIPPNLFKTQSSVALFALLAVVVAPFAEETFFRGFVFSGLSRRFGFWGGAIISAALFAAAHASLGALIPIFLLGLLLAALYARTRSLWLPMTAHALYNGLAVLAVVLNLPY
ncbi:MAG: CPBP family glutamic-type intramembrane protease [Dehalococcoidia bacterium]|nr:CPBP family glutamic-type intramembrane protease [Dehalococcoidia bacterium]